MPKENLYQNKTKDEFTYPKGSEIQLLDFNNAKNLVLYFYTNFHSNIFKSTTNSDTDTFILSWVFGTLKLALAL